MKLAELEPQFLRAGQRRATGKFLKAGIDPLRGNWTDADFEERDYDQTFHTIVNSLVEADGVDFLNPAEFVKNGGSVGTSHIHVWFKGKALFGDINTSKSGEYIRWNVSGTSFHDLTITPSILIAGPSAWHGFITNGEIITV